MKKIHVTEEDIQRIFAESLANALRTKVTPTSISLSSLNNSVTLKDEEKAKVKILPEAGKKLKSLVKACDKEIAWHGTVERSPDNDREFLITDILVFPQKVSAATVVTDDTEYSLNWLYNANGEGITDEQFSKLRYHGHSHVNMGVFPSGTDTTYQQNLLENAEDFYIFSIHNKSGAVWTHIYDVTNNVIYENVDVIWEGLEDQEEIWAKEQIKKYVKTEQYTYNYGGGKSYSNSYPAYNNASNLKWSNEKKEDKKEKVGGYPPALISGGGKRVIDSYNDDDDYDYEYGWEALYRQRMGRAL